MSFLKISLTAFFVYVSLFFSSLVLGDQSMFLPEANVDIGFRVRHETVKQGGNSSQANTIKLRIKNQLRWNEAFQAYFEFDHVEAFRSHYNDGIDANNEFIIADPESTEINQAFLAFTQDEYRVQLGRQLIEYGNERHIGSVAFRQNDQTYDAVTLNISLLTASRLDFAFIDNVNRIFGDQADSALKGSDLRFVSLNGDRPLSLRGNHRMESYLLNFEFNEWDFFQINTYTFFIHNKTFAAFSNNTGGIKGEYKQKINNITWFVGAELAKQKKQKTNMNAWLTYSLVEFGLTSRPWTLSVRQEVLGEASGQAFITPLGTLHKFQGWAGQFLITPSQGLRDAMVSISWKRKQYGVDVRFHRFDTIKQSTHIGDELNVDISYKPTRRHNIKIRLASFNETDSQGLNLADIKKMFLMYRYQL